MIFPRWMYHPVKGGKIFNSLPEFEADQAEDPRWFDSPAKFKNPPPGAVTVKQAEGIKGQGNKHPFTEKDVRGMVKANLYKVAQEHFKFKLEAYEVETVKGLKGRILEAMAADKPKEGEG